MSTVVISMHLLFKIGWRGVFAADVTDIRVVLGVLSKGVKIVFRGIGADLPKTT